MDNMRGSSLAGTGLPCRQFWINTLVPKGLKLTTALCLQRRRMLSLMHVSHWSQSHGSNLIDVTNKAVIKKIVISIGPLKDVLRQSTFTWIAPRVCYKDTTRILRRNYKRCSNLSAIFIESKIVAIRRGNFNRSATPGVLPNHPQTLRTLL